MRIALIIIFVSLLWVSNCCGAIELRSVGAKSSGFDSITLDIPGDITANDILVAAVSSYDNGTLSMDGDWTEIFDASEHGGNDRLAVYWHRYDGETAPSTGCSGSSFGMVGGVAVFSGCDTVDSPFHIVGAGNGGTDSSIEHTSISPTVDNCMLLVCNAAANDNSRSDLSGYSAAFDEAGSNTYAEATWFDVSINMFYKIVSTGATGTITVTQDGGPDWTSVLLALEPAAAAAGAPQVMIISR